VLNWTAKKEINLEKCVINIDRDYKPGSTANYDIDIQFKNNLVTSASIYECEIPAPEKWRDYFELVRRGRYNDLEDIEKEHIPGFLRKFKNRCMRDYYHKPASLLFLR